jgi:hypothetical protein
MRKKPKRLFLYLAIACFVGLVAIFIVDGYLGIYDTFHISVGEYPPQTIEANYWLRQSYEGYDIPRTPGTEGDKYAYCCIGADWGQDISFDYVIENHQSSAYSGHIEASVWQENRKLIDLFSQDVLVRPFREETVEWTLSSEQIGITEPVTGYSYTYTVLVNRGDVERRIIVSYYYSGEIPYPKRVPAEMN